MDANRNKQDLHEEIATTDYDGRGNLMAVEAPTTLRRPNSTGDEKTPTGPPPNQGAAKKRFCQTLTAKQCGSATTASNPRLPHNFEQIRHRAQEIYRGRRGIWGIAAKLRKAIRIEIPIGYQDEAGFHTGVNEIGRNTVLAIIWTATTIWLGTVQAWSQTLPTDSASDAVLTSKPSNTNIWQGEVGDGFRSSVQTVSLEVGAAAGFQAFGGEQNHNLALISLSYGHMLGDVVGNDHWYRGNWEIRGEFFSGAQFSPSAESLVGLTPHLRYNLATGTRWVPFADLGAGVTATSIGPPDLSGTFEFNLQANTGVNWFVRDNIALTFEAGYMHFSCAGTHDPNQGLNCVKGLVGITWFF